MDGEGKGFMADCVSHFVQWLIGRAFVIYCFISSGNQVNFDLVDRYKKRVVVCSWLTCAFGHVASYMAIFVTGAVQASIQTGVVFLRSCCLDVARDEVVPQCGWAPLPPVWMLKWVASFSPHFSSPGWKIPPQHPGMKY